MPPKKPNGFMVFALEWKSKYGRNLSMSECTTEAGKIWTTMNIEQRAPYNDRAKEERIMSSRSAAVKLTCTGIPVSQVEKERLDQENKERLMKRDIEATVRKSLKEDQLENQSYIFIMANYFTKTMKGGVYVPAEIALCKFSLKDGVSSIYHMLINPGVNIYGHQYEAQQHSESTHNLPLPPNALGEKNLGGIYNDILKFIRDEGSSSYPPIYTLRDSIHIVESILEFLKADIGANNADLKVYAIQYLFYIMKEATCEVGELTKPQSCYITDAFFERDFFEFQIGIGCEFHEEMDKSKYCTQSYVTRWGYMFADYMCSDIAIPMIEGRHCPVNTNLNAVITPAPSTCNDNESYFSVGTTGTFGTKAVAGSKPYYDDQKSSVSNASTSYTNDRYSDARRKQRDTPSPKRYKSLRKDPDSSDTDDANDSMNPWTSRSRNILPSEPDNSHFDINYTRDLSTDVDDFNSVASFGRGRGSLLNSSFGVKSSTSNQGRGRFFR